jgi:uncharacterized Zn finger protein
MKKNNFTLFLFLIFSILSYSQPRFKEKREQIKALKVAFITNELSLTSEEAATFWPLYNAYDNKQMEIRHKKIKSFIDRFDKDAIDKMTEKEAAALLTQFESIDEEVFLNRKKFINSLKGVLPSIKIIKLKRSEDDFNKKLLHQYREKGSRN